MNKLILSDFINRGNKVHNNKYDYSYVVLNGARNKVDIICPIHGIFNQTPSNHMAYGCMECGKIKSKKSSVSNIIYNKFKNIIQPEDHKIIPIKNGVVCKVDNDLFDDLKKYNWSFVGSGNYCENKKLGRLHRYILKCPKDKVVDHINGDVLDNRRINLRICTRIENSYNSKPRIGSSVYKGVYKKRNKWQSEIYKDYKRYDLGTHLTEKEAGLAYNKKAKELFGEFAKLNLI